MKNVFLFPVIAGILFFFNSCEKCYQCHNECKRCQYNYIDTTLTIIVCSEKLSEKYYIEYIDSLTSPSLGWTCVGAGSNFTERFCESESKSAIELIYKKEGGMICASE